MAVHKYKDILRPKKRTASQRIGKWLLQNHKLVIYTGMGIVFLLTLMILQANAQADYLMQYGSGY